MTEFEIGSSVLGREIGKVGNASGIRFVLTRCPDCNTEHWVEKFDLIREKIPGLCKKCSTRGRNHWDWKGGRRIDEDGYIALVLQPDDPFYGMVSTNGEVPEHRYVMAKKLGRSLESWEIVHHKGTRFNIESDGNKQDNLEDNLELVTTSENLQIKEMVLYINKLKHDVEMLRILLLGVLTNGRNNSESECSRRGYSGSTCQR